MQLEFQSVKEALSGACWHEFVAVLAVTSVPTGNMQTQTSIIMKSLDRTGPSQITNSQDNDLQAPKTCVNSTATLIPYSHSLYGVHTTS